MRITDFDLYRDLLKEKLGVVLTPEKSYLLESRLTPVAKKWGYHSLETMTIALHGVPDKELISDIVEAMATAETSFFRESSAFRYFTDAILPAVMKARGRKRQIKIWCAGCSSGQEPYSLAILLKENEAKLTGWKVDILSTDISNELLTQARSGAYSQFEVQRGLPVQMLIKHFAQTDEGDKWQIRDPVKKNIRFQQFSMLDNITTLGTFDVIFCRNVLTGFEDETRARIFETMTNMLEKDGFLVLGGDETLPSSVKSLEATGSQGVYATGGGSRAKALA